MEGPSHGGMMLPTSPTSAIPRNLLAWPHPQISSKRHLHDDGGEVRLLRRVEGICDPVDVNGVPDALVDGELPVHVQVQRVVGAQLQSPSLTAWFTKGI